MLLVQDVATSSLFHLKPSAFFQNDVELKMSIIAICSPSNSSLFILPLTLFIKHQPSLPLKKHSSPFKVYPSSFFHYYLIVSMSRAMQSILVSSPVTGLASRPSIPLAVSPSSLSMRIRCMSTEQSPEQSSSTPVVPPQLTPEPPRKPKVSTKFSDLLAFSGPAPERINGRLAMIGFVAALAVELSSGEDVFTQIANGGVPVFLGTSVLLTLASLVPLFKGIRVESKSGEFMSSDAELWNGRFAMLGLVALAFTEYVKGGAFI